MAQTTATRKGGKNGTAETAEAKPTAAQRRWLERGVDQAGGKLPLFDLNGRRVNGRTIRSCIDMGWAEPWFANPLKPDWEVCKLTEAGRRALDET